MCRRVNRHASVDVHADMSLEMRWPRQGGVGKLWLARHGTVNHQRAWSSELWGREQAAIYSYGCIVEGSEGTVMAYIVMAYIVMAYTVMAYTVMAYIVMPYILMAASLKGLRVRLWPM